MNVLILGGRRDGHVVRVSERLTGLGVEVRILDHDAPGDFALILGSDGEVALRIDGVAVVPDVVWMRPKIRPQSGVTLEEHAEGHVRRAQWLGSYREIAACLANKIYNDHEDAFLDYKKFFQMRVARRCGFRIPVGMISNDRRQLLDFVGGHESAIAKPIGASSVMKIGGNGKLVFQAMLTSRIDRDLAVSCDEESFRYCPALVQDEIGKDFELRIYADRSRVFAISLRSQEHAATQVDWRPGEPFIAKDVFPVPPEFEIQLLELIRELGLAYGVIDMIVDKEGKHWFLECNPEGQWASIDSAHKGALSAHIASDMVRRIEAARAAHSGLESQEALTCP